MIHRAGKISSRRSATSGVGLGSGKRREVGRRDVLTIMVINNITQIMKEKVTTIMGVRLGTKTWSLEGVTQFPLAYFHCENE